MAHLACIGRKTKYRVCPFSRKAYFDLDGVWRFSVYLFRSSRAYIQLDSELVSVDIDCKMKSQFGGEHG